MVAGAGNLIGEANMPYLKLKDLDTNPPDEAIICPRCHGFRIIIVGPTQSTDDCPRCGSNGWILNGEIL